MILDVYTAWKAMPPRSERLRERRIRRHADDVGNAELRKVIAVLTNAMAALS